MAAWKKDQHRVRSQRHTQGAPDRGNAIGLLRNRRRAGDSRSVDQRFRRRADARCSPPESLNAKSLNSALDFGENDKLMDFFAARFDGGFEGAKKTTGGQERRRPASQGRDGRQGDAGEAAPRLRLHHGRGLGTGEEGQPLLHGSGKVLQGALSEGRADQQRTDARRRAGVHRSQDRGADRESLYRVARQPGRHPAVRVRRQRHWCAIPKNPKSLHGDSHLSPMEVRDALHPPGGGKSTLRDVSAKIDGKTTIHIRGCDLGQNKEFVNLIDEAFGGKGQVIASTHEQVYGTNTELAKRARAKAKKDIEDSEPMPPPVDPEIKDKAAKRTAMQAREKALKERQSAHRPEAEGPEGRHRRSRGAGPGLRGDVGRRHAAARQQQVHRGGSDGRDRTPLPASRQEAARCPHRRRPARAASGEADLPEFPRQRAHHLRPGLECLRAGR